MKKLAAITFTAILSIGVAASSAMAQAESDALRRWDESVDALLRRVSPSVVQIMVTGYGAISEGDRGNAGVVIGKQKAIGSGFVIDASGYILTNAHVVKMLDQELKYNIASKGLTELVGGDIASVEKAIGFKLSAEYENRLANAIFPIYARYMTMGTPITTSEVYMGVAVPGVGTVQKGIPCEIKRVGEPSPGKDVAILKINANNLPTLSLGDDKLVRDGDQAVALGYPGVATFNAMLAQTESNIKPSLTVGSISARKTMPGGWDVLQTDTAITHGNSGGPLFNNKGEPA